MAKKLPRVKGIKASAVAENLNRADDVPSPAGDPLRAFPADPPPRNLPLLILSAVLFAIWFCFLIYVALAT